MFKEIGRFIGKFVGTVIVIIYILLITFLIGIFTKILFIVFGRGWHLVGGI